VLGHIELARAAREAPDQALAIFEQFGARLWSDKSRAELKRSLAASRPRTG
jgi:hypothetical protein